MPEYDYSVLYQPMLEQFFMPEDEEENLIHFDSSDFVELPDYDPDFFIDYDEGDE